MHLRRVGPIIGRSKATPLPTLRYYFGHPECQPRARNPFFDPGFDDSIWGSQPRTIIGGKQRVTMAGGVGIGPELMDIVNRIFYISNAPVNFEALEFEKAEDDDVDNLIYSVERNGVAIKGHFDMDMKPDELVTKSYRMKRALDLVVNLVEIKSYKALAEKTRLKGNVDVVIICPNSEGAFALLEHEHGRGVEYLRVTTEYNTRRVADFAFEYAFKRKRRRVTLVYNKGIMNWAEGSIIAAVSQVATRYPDINFHKQSMKAFMFKVKNFNAYNGDVIITMPLYGGIIKNIMFGLMHASGLYCAQNIGPRYAVFEAAARNKGTKMVGRNIVNPVAMLDAGVKMLKFLDHHESALLIQRAIEETIEIDKVHTQDMLGTATTSEMVANIERRIMDRMPEGYRGEVPVVTSQPPLLPDNTGT